ncbi:hypothetical protein [Nocardioides sp. SR21]|uniref:divisome protein SepX/GlpR n=1 Tax=Nocardioides sp. SR21 TaxID=2919501 RepID=UPI001FAA5DB8|nr:hypothetical protein [Nocardioides sp. SR21]
MDLSALIFVALAAAWAAYLVPMALRHHEDDVRGRSVDRFSRTMRVLARREPVDSRKSQLVTPGQPAATVEATPAPAAAKQPLSPAARRAAAKRATQRRRNVLALILVATLAVTGVAAFGVISWWYVAIPVAVLAAWLVTCRIMVKGERKALAPEARLPFVPAEEEPEPATEVAAAPAAEVEADTDEIDPMADTSAGMAAVVDPALWDPVPVTLPTYVTKPAATRTVRTIAFDDTGVWTSGRTDADAQLAREAEQADKAARQSRDNGERATGS